MALIQNTNVPSIIAQRRLSFNTAQLNKSLERLSSGLKINHASDDAAGLTISENLISQITSNKKALQNTQDGISILQVAEGALSVVLTSLQRIRELAIQAATDTNAPTQRQAIAQEIRAMADDIDRISQSTEFNGISLLNGSATNAILQVGPNSTLATNTMNISAGLANVGTDADSAPPGIGLIGSLGSTTAGFTSLNDIFNPGTGTTMIVDTTTATNFLQDVDAAINTVSSRLSTIGSFQNRLDSMVTNLEFAIENFSASNSRIRDLDIANESSNYVQNQILQQSSVSVLAQANQSQQMILSLLQN